MSDEVALFGRALGRALGEGPPPTSLGVQRANLLVAAHRLGRQRSRPRWELGLGLAAAFAAAAAAALWVGHRLSEPLLLSARWNGQEVGESAELAVPLSASKPLEFSDGSQVLFDPSSHARLARLRPERAALRLDQGRFVASIRHHPGMTWAIAAGPYTVEVVGTKFSVDWRGDPSSLKVEVSEGCVRVTGGDLEPGGVALYPGQRLERQAKPIAEPTLRPAPVPTASPAALATSSERAPAPLAAASAREPSISALTQAGKYRQALELAERQGFERVIGELGENELLMLGNAARYAGSAGRARQALLKLRERFPGRPASELSALYLARVAEQADNRPQEAVRWLRIFLQESPTGDLAQGARASLLSILSAQGDTAGARAVAEDYLRYHPQGPLAEQARSLVSRTTPR